MDIVTVLTVVICINIIGNGILVYLLKKSNSRVINNIPLTYDNISCNELNAIYTTINNTYEIRDQGKVLADLKFIINKQLLMLYNAKLNKLVPSKLDTYH